MQSCKDDYYKSPESTVFEFVSTSGDNLIQNETLTDHKIVVQQDNGNWNFTGFIIEIRDDNKVILKSVGQFEGNRKYNVYLTTDLIKTFNFRVSSSKLTDQIKGYKINNPNVENITATKENRNYKIKVD